MQEKENRDLAPLKNKLMEIINHERAYWLSNDRLEKFSREIIDLIPSPLKEVKEKIEGLKTEASASYNNYGENYQLGQSDAYECVLNMLDSTENDFNEQQKERQKLNKVWHTVYDKPEVDKTIIIL